MTRNYRLLKAIISTALAIGCFYVSFAFAQGLGSMADNVRAAMTNFAKLITATSYLAGLAFAVIAVLKFKAHKDDSRTTPISTPIVLLFVAAGLLFLPGLFKAAGETLGIEGDAGAISGMAEIT